MHEMSIAMNIVEIVSTHVQNEGGSKVHQIEVEVGDLAGVLTDSLEFCFEAASKNTVADGAELKIIDIPGKGKCQECDKEFAVDSFLTLCPYCNGFSVDLIQGKELRVRSITID